METLQSVTPCDYFNFSGTKKPLSLIMVMLYFWSHKIRNGQVYRMLKEHVTRVPTVGYWFNEFRNVCSNYLLKHPVKLGGVGDIVEIDETKIGKYFFFYEKCPFKNIHTALFTLLA